MNIPDKLKRLISLLEHTDVKSEDELNYIVNSMHINIADISDYINFRHPLNESYGRKIIYESKKIEMVTMSWNIGDFTSIHDHGQAQWGLVLSFGAVQNSIFEISKHKLMLIDEQILNAGEITILDNSAIHQMGNSNLRPSVSLHIYYTQKSEKGVTAEARNYDLYDNKIYKANGGAFLLLAKENIVSEEKCPDYDQALYEKQFVIRRNFIDKCCPVNMRKKYPSTSINIHNEQR